MTGNDDNGKVKLAERLVRIEATQEALRDDIAALRSYLAQVIGELKKCDEDHEVRIRSNEKALTKHSERLGILASAQAVFSLTTSSIAAWLGSKL